MTIMKTRLRTYFVIVMLAGMAYPAYGQTRQSDQDSQDVASKGSKAQTEDKQPSGLSEDIRELKARLDALQTIVDQQQQALAAMQKRLNAMNDKETVGAVVPASASNTTEAAPANAIVGAQQIKNGDPKDKTASAQTAPDKPLPTAGWNGNHAFLRTADGSFETNLAGYAQLDFRGYQSGVHPPNTFLVRRARMAFEGKLYKYFEFRIEGDFADTNNLPLRDFYVTIHRIDEFQMRFGQTREPFSQEEMRSDNLQDFVERSLVNNLAPSRTPGIMAFGTLQKGTFEYQVGVFNGKGLLQNNNNGTPDQALRLRFNPWKQSQSFWLKGLLFGGAYNQGRSVNGLSIRGQSESRLTFFQPEIVNGKLYRANGEITWLLGPATLRAEYDQTNQFRDNLGAGGTNLPGVIAKGYMAQFTYLLTGESKPDVGTVTPKRNLFDEGNGGTGLGAWELKLRYSNLQVDDRSARSNRAGTIYFGTNWYMNKFVRYMLDIGLERFRDPLRRPNPSDKNFLTVLSRFQIQF